MLHNIYTRLKCMYNIVTVNNVCLSNTQRVCMKWFCKRDNHALYLKQQREIISQALAIILLL